MENPTNQENEVAHSPGFSKDESAECCTPTDAKLPMAANDEKVENSVLDNSACLGDENLEPYVGMEFESEEAARNFYNEYSKRVGFGIRINSYYRSKKDKTIISRQIVCSKEGFRRQRDAGDEGIRRPRPITREGCKAMIIVRKRECGKWYVAKFEKNHNHTVNANQLHSFRSHRRILDPKRKLIDIFEEGTGAEDVMNVDENLEPYIGMEFESEEAAKNFYNNYGRHAGFSIRINTYYRSKKDKTIISRQFVCSKEGFRRKKDASGDEVRQPRLTTREGCKAMLIVRKQECGKWVIAKFEKTHNHPLVSSNEVHLLRSHRRLSDAKRKLINASKDAGTDTGDITNVLREKSGGICDDGSAENDCRNDIDKEMSCCGVEMEGNSQECTTLRFNSLCQEAIKCAQEGATSIDAYKVALCAMQEAWKKIVAAKENASMDPQIVSLACENNNENNINKISWPESLMNQVAEQDPQLVKTNGYSTINTRDREKCKKPVSKKRVWSMCKVAGHDSRNCQMSKGLGSNVIVQQSEHGILFVANQYSSLDNGIVKEQLNQARLFVPGQCNSQDKNSQGNIPQS